MLAQCDMICYKFYNLTFLTTAFWSGGVSQIPQVQFWILHITLFMPYHLFTKPRSVIDYVAAKTTAHIIADIWQLFQ